MKITSFRQTILPARVTFGSGTLAALPEEAALLGIRRALIVCTAPQRDLAGRAAELLAGRAAAIYANAAMHTPEHVTQDAMAGVLNGHIDGIVAVGGGSAIGLSKAIALRTDLPQIVVPTTYAGSEATPIIGETKNGAKTTQRSMKVLPETILYDVDLTLTLPVSASMTSGLNAMAHAAEALYATQGSPLISQIAEEALAAMIDALPRIRLNADDRQGRSNALYAAWLCGTCLGSVGMALHHKICHSLGGTFDLPHAELHAIMLPHVLAYNLPAAQDARQRFVRLLGSEDPAIALEKFARGLEIPRALRDIGMPQDGIDHAAGLAVATPYPNPRPIEREAIRAMLARAWAGEFPAASV
jgi:alcohol dehydrogenase class IV